MHRLVGVQDSALNMLDSIDHSEREEEVNCLYELALSILHSVIFWEDDDHSEYYYFLRDCMRAAGDFFHCFHAQIVSRT